MSCSNITQGISKGCNNNLGGIRNIYISEQPITGYTLSGNLITGFSPSPTWLTVEADQGTGNFTETYEINQMGGIVAFKQSVTFQINDLSAYNQQRIQELAESTNLGVVVEMNNGKFFTVGIERGAYLETGSTSSGTAYGDLSGSTITITGMEKISSLEVSPVAVGQVRDFSAKFEWIERSQCLGGTPAGNYYFRNGTYNNAKCEYDACNQIIQSDPLGCYPLTSSAYIGNGQTYRVPVNQTVEVGLQLYNFNGTISTDNFVCWNVAPGVFPIIIESGGYSLNPIMAIVEVTNGIITKYDNQANITCTP